MNEKITKEPFLVGQCMIGPNQHMRLLWAVLPKDDIEIKY